MIERNVNGADYFDLLYESVVPGILKDFHDENFYFYHDHRCVTSYLDEILLWRWIRRKGPTHYLVRSPDLISLDFFFWRFPKNKVYFKKPQTVAELQVVIEKECDQILNEMLLEVSDSISSCYQKCLHKNTYQFMNKH